MRIPLIMLCTVIGVSMEMLDGMASGQDNLPAVSRAARTVANEPIVTAVTEKSLPDSIGDLKSSDGRTVYTAFLAIARLNATAEPAVPPLVDLLKDPKAEFVVKDFSSPGNIMGPARRFTYAQMSRQTLLAIGPITVPYLLKAIEEKSPSLQHEAALVLGGLARDNHLGEKAKSESIIKSMSAYLQRNASSLSVDDLKTMGFTQAPEASMELILKLQKNTNYETRAWAALALGELKSPGAIPVLEKALGHDHDELVRQFSAVALGRFPKDASLQNALIVALLNDKESSVRAACATSLQGAMSQKIIIALTKALADASAEVRLNAAKFFWDVKSDNSVPALMIALEKETEYLTRDYIMLALTRQNAKEALPLVEKILKDKSKSASHDTAQFAKDVLTGKRTIEESEYAK
jgi:HEAT repeat protein